MGASRPSALLSGFSIVRSLVDIRDPRPRNAKMNRILRIARENPHPVKGEGFTNCGPRIAERFTFSRNSQLFSFGTRQDISAAPAQRSSPSPGEFRPASHFPCAPKRVGIHRSNGANGTATYRRRKSQTASARPAQTAAHFRESHSGNLGISYPRPIRYEVSFGIETVRHATISWICVTSRDCGRYFKRSGAIRF